MDNGTHEEVRTVSDGQREWPIPVVTWADRRNVFLTVTEADGEVIASGPSVPYVMSVTSRQMLHEALDQAFAQAQRRDQGLS